MKSLEVAKDNVALENDLANNKRCKKMIGFIRPYIPMVGLLSSGVTVGAHIVEKRCSKNEE